jgi:hypothetical protein
MRGWLRLLDSGGYESSHYERFSSESSNNRWTLEDLLKHASSIEFDLLFGYDVFPTEGERPQAYADRVVVSLARHNEIPEYKRIPVLNLLTKKGATVFDGKGSNDLVRIMSETFGSEFIAIPERELGIGVIQRAVHARQLVNAVGGTSCKIHALGCGNPLTISLLGVAGVAMMDGLE